MAGALVLEADGRPPRCHLVCDRCAKPFAREKTVRIGDAAGHGAGRRASDDEIVLLDGDEVDLDERGDHGVRPRNG